MELQENTKKAIRRNCWLIILGFGAPVYADTWPTIGLDAGNRAVVAASTQTLGLDGGVAASVVTPVFGPESAALLMVGVVALLFIRRFRA